jgi:glycosyltransferase involved in cell wall biosynthesis
MVRRVVTDASREDSVRVVHEPPTVGIVTPSYNLARHLRETIDSVLGQDWPYVDYLVMDGGSRDGTRELLEGYGPRIRWVSAPDGGQADAVNRGFTRTQGAIFAFLNADDTYRPEAIRRAVEGFERRPDAGVVYGDADFVDPEGRVVLPYPVADFDREALTHFCFICQPAAFAARGAWEACGGLDDRMQYAMDYDMWIRMSARYPFVRIDGNLATSRMRSDNKSLGGRVHLYREAVDTVKRHYGYVPITWLEAYSRFLVDRVDQFYSESPTSWRSRTVALALGARWNPRHLRRFWREWRIDGQVRRTPEDWLARAPTTRIAVPAGARRLLVTGHREAATGGRLVLRVAADGQPVGHVVVTGPGAFEHAVPLPRTPDGPECEVGIAAPPGRRGWRIEAVRFG